MSTRVAIAMTVNGETRSLEVPACSRLADVLRSNLSLTGTKIGCDVGECGACTVLVDGMPTLACLVLAAELDGCEITTIEHASDERLSTLKATFVAEAALQCGFCTPGMILAASVLERGAGDSAIRTALAGNICRCTGYTKIVSAVRRGLGGKARGRKG